MKSILYVGATLMIGASIYGFADYKKTSRQAEFTRMYQPAEEKEPVVTTEVFVPATKEIAPAVNTKKKAVARGKTMAIKSKIEITAAEKIESAPVLVTAPVKETVSAKKFKQAKKKKLNHRLFSRAPLREEQEVVLLPEPAKKEITKTEKKEQ